jgi:hypothetical protein
LTRHILKRSDFARGLPIFSRPSGRDERACGVEGDPQERVKVRLAVRRQGKAAGKNCKSKKERAFSVRTLRRRPHVFHRETSSSFVYSDRRQRRKAGLAYFIWKLFA